VKRRWSQRALIALPKAERYAIAVAATLIGTLLRLVLSPLWAPNELPFITFFPAVMVSAWIGGLGPGLVTTLLSAAIANFLWVEPRYSFAILHAREAVALLIYVLMGAVISALNELWRRAAADLARSERWLRTTLNSIGDAVITTDVDGRISNLNRVAEQLTGWREVEAAGREFDEVLVLINERSRRPAEHPIQRVIEEEAIAGLVNDTLLIAKDGREVPIEDSAAPIAGGAGGGGSTSEGVVMVFRDVTERKRAERERAARLNDRHTVVLTNAERLAGMGSWRWIPATNALTWSAELYRIYGVEPGTPLSFDTFLERVDPAERARVRAIVEAAVRDRKAFRLTERIVRPDGEVRVLDSVGDVEVEGDQLVALFGFCRDVTDETRTRQAMQEQEERFAKLFQASPAASVLTTAREGRVLDVNRRFLALTGYTREEIIGQTAPALGLWSASERNGFLQRLREQGSLAEIDVSFRTKEGQRRRALAAIERLTIGGEDCLLKLFWRV
jgi:PAS domain S-box-containing protein